MKEACVFVSVLLILTLSVPIQSVGQQRPGDHLVTPDQLSTALVDKSAKRSQHVGEIEKLLSHHEIRNRLGSLVDLEKIENRIASLDDATLERLATESRTVNDRIQAGVSNVGWAAIIVVAITVVILAS